MISELAMSCADHADRQLKYYYFTSIAMVDKEQLHRP